IARPFDTPVARRRRREGRRAHPIPARGGGSLKAGFAGSRTAHLRSRIAGQFNTRLAHRRSPEARRVKTGNARGAVTWGPDAGTARRPVTRRLETWGPGTRGPKAGTSWRPLTRRMETLAADCGRSGRKRAAPPPRRDPPPPPPPHPPPTNTP